MNGASANPASASADYRRQARRIRASFFGNSFLTQQALHELAKTRNIETGKIRPPLVAARRATASQFLQASEIADPPSSPLLTQISAVVERGFAEHAASRRQSFGFTFSDRVALLATAEKLGISRFRANLILAMQENQSAARAPARPALLKLSLPWFFTVLVIEVLIVLAMVWIVTR